MLVELSVVEQRYHAVMEVLAGAPVTEVAARYGVSRKSVHAWVARYREGGLGGLVDRSHRPRAHPWQLSPEVEAVVVQLRTAHPRWGPRRLVHELGRAGVVPVPSRSTRWRRSTGSIRGGGRDGSGWSAGRGLEDRLLASLRGATQASVLKQFARSGIL